MLYVRDVMHCHFVKKNKFDKLWIEYKKNYFEKKKKLLLLEKDIKVYINVSYDIKKKKKECTPH
jgi:hypothetical protein